MRAESFGLNGILRYGPAEASNDDYPAPFIGRFVNGFKHTSSLCSIGGTPEFLSGFGTRRLEWPSFHDKYAECWVARWFGGRCTSERDKLIASLNQCKFPRVEPQSIWAPETAFLLRTIENTAAIGAVIVLAIAVAWWIRHWARSRVSAAQRQ